MKAILSFLLAMSLLLSMAACTSTQPGQTPSDDTSEESVFDLTADDSVIIREERSETNKQNPLIVGIADGDGGLNPLYLERESEYDIASLLHTPLLELSADALPTAGLTANALCYSYAVTDHEDGSSSYDFILKNGVKTADGKVVGADDLLATLYVMLDPLYDGTVTLNAMDIRGLKEYLFQPTGGESASDAEQALRDQARARLDAVVDGRSTDAEAIAVVDGFVRDAIAADAETLKSYLNENGCVPDMSTLGLSGFPANVPHKLALAAYFGALCYENETYLFADESGLSDEKREEYTLEQIIDGCAAYVKAAMSPASFDKRYDWNCVTDNGEGNRSLEALYRAGYAKRMEETSFPVKSISGLEKGLVTCEDGIVRESVTLTLNSINSNAPWAFNFFVLSKDVFAFGTGETRLNAVGLPFASEAFMSRIRTLELTSGTGPYRLDLRENGEIHLSANESFFLGRSEVKTLILREVSQTDSFEKVMSGEIHFAKTTASSDKITKLKSDAKYAGMGYLTVDFLGYGYIGLNPALIDTVQERRALISTMDTSLSLLSYTADLAETIHRPNTLNSWTYPDGADAYYPYDESGETAKALFLEAGFVYKDEKMLDADGHQLSYVYTLATDLNKHPAGRTFLKSKEILEKVGVRVEIVTDEALADVLIEGDTAVWAAAWTSSADADVFSIYCSDKKLNTSSDLPNVFGLFRLFESGSEEEKAICIEINETLYAIRRTSDIKSRKALYRTLYDKIMELGVELPTYQKKDLYVYNRAVIDESTVLPQEECGYFLLPTDRLWQIRLLGN